MNNFVFSNYNDKDHTCAMAGVNCQNELYIFKYVIHNKQKYTITTLMPCLNCGTITKTFLPNSLIEIKENTFHNCNNLREIYFMGTQEEWEQINKGENWEPSCEYAIIFEEEEEE